jgi:hypothetical protein
VYLLPARGVTQPHPSTLSLIRLTAYTIAVAKIKTIPDPAIGEPARLAAT